MQGEICALAQGILGLALWAGCPVCTHCQDVVKPVGAIAGEVGDSAEYCPVNVNWNGYEIYYPRAVGPAHELPRSDARREFDALMKAVPERIEMFRRLLAANGIVLASTDAGIQDVNDWFLGSVESDPARPGRLLPEWYSVVRDVALFLGDTLIRRCPGLRWEFFTWGAKDVAYQHHVIMGFTQVPNRKYNLDLERGVAAYGHRIIASRGSVAQLGRVTVRGVEIDLDAATAAHGTAPMEVDAFWRWIKAAELQA